MIYYKIMLWGVLLQISLSSCTYEQLPEFSSTVSYGSQLLSDNEEEEQNP